ncbi:heparan sulfate 2-O-sulfotransferase 1-like [Clavelina lepadiformis]|uniref:Heparan sulfate 2-O-sulfotransferase 1 n=1 Tax=Clavelina lepadiformis TaxID=159417 RepID=A0ABP0GCJ9_CLALP
MRVSRQIALTKRPIVLFGVLVVFIFFFLEMQIGQLKSENKELRDSVDNLPNENHIRSLLSPLHAMRVTDQSNEPLVVYNRVPKTGSTSFTHQVYALTKENQIYVLHVNISANSLKMALPDQYKMVQNMTSWKERKPAFYHGHFAYVDFEQFGAREPIYINILREPLDRLISHYYFMRYGDNLRKGLKRKRQGDTTTFDECVAQKGHSCDPRELWLQVPLLCGQLAECWKVGSQWALERAKQNLLTRYTLVGLTEKMEEFIVVLEAILPNMFKGISSKYRTGKDSHVRNTSHKEMPSEETIATMKSTKVYRMEKELYDFAAKQFEFILKTSTVLENGILQPKTNLFHYEKIYGPKGLIKS